MQTKTEISAAQRQAQPSIAEDGTRAAVLRRLNRRILLPLTLGMCLAYWCRVNISYGALQMNQALGMGAESFGFSVGILFAAYALFEVPSSYALVRVGARRWLFLMVFVWGLGTLATAFVTNVESLYAVRFLIGAAEAGYPAACAYCIARWYPLEERRMAVSRWMTTVLGVMALAGPASTVIMAAPGGGIANWQWLFIIGGVPTIALAFFFLKRFDDRAADATWLPPDSKAWLAARLGADSPAAPGAHAGGFGQAFRSAPTWIYGSMLILQNSAAFILLFWFPQIVRSARSDLSMLEVGLFSSIPVLVAVPVNILVTRSLRRTGDSRWHLAGLSLLASTAMIVALQSKSEILLGLAVIIGVSCLASCMIILLTLPTITLKGDAVAGASALINSGAQLGAMIGPYVMGLLKDRTGSFEAGLYFSAAVVLAATLIPLALGRFFPTLPRAPR